MKNIKILVATHKKYKMPADTSVYLPIHVGCEGKKNLGFQEKIFLTYPLTIVNL